MNTDAAVQTALESAWHRDSAESSLERWLELCQRNDWGRIPRDLPMLVRVFGASWYFTRFAFSRGSKISGLFDRPEAGVEDVPALLKFLAATLPEGAMVDRLNALRVAKNEAMLKILIQYLAGRLDQTHSEIRLTMLAEAALALVMEMFELDPRRAGCRLAVLGMGRLAGREMTFGSDLDLIFLYQGAEAGESPAFARKVRLLLRNIAALTPEGILYDVDMRLRPHGTAGALITSRNSFIDYHARRRDTWERQVMTRCRPIYDPVGLGAETLERVLPKVYSRYDLGNLARDIHCMRMRVESELGRPRGKFELKRGKGGIMDVDFCAHYLQLGHGAEIPALRVCGTREALRAAAEAGLVASGDVAALMHGYDYLRRMETCLRLFDLNSTSAFSEHSRVVTALARAMGYGTGDVEAMMSEYREVTAETRAQFEAIVAPIP